MKKIIYLLLFFIGNLPYASASHMISAELGWTGIGQDSFMIKLTLYTDCNGVQPGSAQIDFFCALTGAAITRLTLTLPNPVDITPVCKSSCTRCQSSSCSFPYGINRYTVQGLVVLSGAGSCCEVKMSLEQCCRTSAITTGAGNTDFYTYTILNRCQKPCDNSPTFSNAPVAILCVGQPFTFNHGVQDNDLDSTGGLADSLTYEWAEPLSATNTPISYLSPYAYNKPINFYGFPNDALPWPRGIHLDTLTGDVQFQPMKSEVTIMVVKVNEFRNGVKIAELRREIQIIAILCFNNNPPSITTNVRSKSVCAGDSVAFDFSTSDPNSNDTVSISWNNTIPGAVWTHTNGQSKYPKARLTWKTTSAEGNALPYTFTVTARDDACPVNASYTLGYQIIVKLRIKGKISVTDLGCGLYHFGLDTTYKQNLNFSIYTEGKKVALDNTHNYKFDTAGVYPYILTVSYPNNCNTLSDTGIITTDTSLLYTRLPADTAICKGTSIIIEPKVFFNQGPVKYLWSTGDTNRILHTGPIKNNTKITLSVKDSGGCTTSRSINITMLKSPLLIPADTLICYGSTFSIEPKTYLKGQVSYKWSNGDTNKILQTGRQYNASIIYLLTAKDSTGCTIDNSILINTMKYYSMFPYNMTSCTGNSVNIEPNFNFTKGSVSFQWSTGDTNKILHTGSLFKDSLISLSILDSTGCTIHDSIIIYMLRNPEITMDDTIGHCKNRGAFVTASYQVFGSNNSLYAVKWHKSGNYSTISNQLELVIPDSGIYVFSIVDKFGCSDSDSVRVNTFPPTDTSLRVNAYVLTASKGMKSYRWFKDDTLISSADSNVFTAPSNGRYYVFLTDSNDCIDRSRTVIINIIGINQLHSMGSVKLYPNPTSGKLMLGTDELLTGEICLIITNMYGREIINRTVKSNGIRTANEIDISDQPAGIYTIFIHYQKNSFHQLIIKE
jgi:hypothetical protein